MKDAVVIKSYPNGISLLLDKECSFDELLEEIGFKFSESKAFFGNARVALSIEGKELNSGEELKILEVIKKNSEVKIVCLVGKDNENNKHYLKALEEMDRRLPKGDSDGQFYKGTLKNNQVLETEQSIVILGDVYPGSAIVSTKNIIVLGGLYGEAYAGASGQDGSYIVALEMEPERLKVGDFKYKATGKTKWGVKPKVQPKIAYAKNGKLVIEPLTKELLESF